MNTKHNLAIGFVGIVLSALAMNSFAESKVNKEPVSVELKTYLITTGKNGQPVSTLVSKAKPNEVIEYRAVYTNNTTSNIKNLVATLPIPAETQFIAKSQPALAQASTDGKAFAPMPLKRQVNAQTVAVPLKDYRALRWTIAELPAGKSVVVSAQTRINSSNLNN